VGVRSGDCFVGCWRVPSSQLAECARRHQGCKAVTQCSLVVVFYHYTLPSAGGATGLSLGLTSKLSLVYNFDRHLSHLCAFLVAEILPTAPHVLPEEAGTVAGGRSGAMDT
jgi:hypothetical protein